MARPFTVQCGYAGYYANTVTVEADSLDEALEKAIKAANRSDAWRSLDHCGDTFVDAVCEGADADPWATDASPPVPDRFSGHGEPPIVTVADPARPDGGIEGEHANATGSRERANRGRMPLRFRSDTGTATAETRDAPHPPDNRAPVTVHPGPDARPDVTGTEGQARVRVPDE